MSINFESEATILAWAEGIWEDFDTYNDTQWQLETELSDMTGEEIAQARDNQFDALARLRRCYDTYKGNV